MANDILRHHPESSDNDIKGVGKSNIVTSRAYKTKNPGDSGADGLASKSDVSNKPGSSIPSIFGRMIFFRTALENVKVPASYGGGDVPVYDEVVSQWLDLLELVFNKSAALKFTQWNARKQIENLRASYHEQLADAFEKHVNKYFGDQLQNIFLIWYKGELVGGTSPYTFVFTSPNWKSGKETRSLLHRESQFREFVYKLYRALVSNSTLTNEIYVKQYSGTSVTYQSGTNPAYDIVSGMLNYIEKSLEHESDYELKAKIPKIGKYTMNDLREEYDAVLAFTDDKRRPVVIGTLVCNDAFTMGGEPMNLQPLELPLLARSPKTIKSDFFIDVEGREFDPTTIPLVLAETGDTKLYYYDNTRWNSDITVEQIENEEGDVEMPECEAYRHSWLTNIHFFDDYLVSLPYRMDDRKFKLVINKDSRSYLLPIKPKALKYLSLDTLVNNTTWKDNGDSITVTIHVPIRNNDGSKRNKIELTHTYNLDTDVVTPVEADRMEKPMSIGISPLLRMPKAEQNRYDVILQYPSESNYDISLRFYAGGSGKDNFIGFADGQDDDYCEIPEYERKHLAVAKFYRPKGTAFDAIDVRMTGKTEDTRDITVHAMVIPNFGETEVMVGNNKYIYAVDFGTTNTHIAFMETNATSATSFKTDELRNMVTYLAAPPAFTEQQGNDMDLAKKMKVVYGKNSDDTHTEQAREFYPNFVKDDYEFPIRTVGFQESGAMRDELFGSMSIGFRYSKEVVNNPNYYTRLKWDLNSYQDPDADTRAKMFFEELLGMIRVHWATRENVDLEHTPVIWLTFPLAMSNKGRIMNLWRDAYQTVFGPDADPQSSIFDLAESLAPAHSLISQGHLGVNGMLNVDIGGGTTDIQYFRKDANGTVARYNSVIFAGDDLWGCGYENMPGETRDVHDNLYTRFADRLMTGKKLTLGFEEKDYSQVQLRGKEKINLLLRDKKNQFANMITGEDNGSSDARKVVMLHYAALLYHLVHWIKSDEKMSEQFPGVINFTGYGSKYIETIFGKDATRDLEQYTKLLLKAYGVDNLPHSFKVQFSKNPKDVTAEGAVIFGRNGANNIPQRPVYHYGVADGKVKGVLRYRDVQGLEKDVKDFFEGYLQGFNSVEDESLIIPQLTDDELRGLRSAADDSFRTSLVNMKNDRDEQGANPIKDSLFFWMLKGSLYNFDTQKH